MLRLPDDQRLSILGEAFLCVPNEVSKKGVPPRWFTSFPQLELASHDNNSSFYPRHIVLCFVFLQCPYRSNNYLSGTWVILLAPDPEQHVSTTCFKSVAGIPDGHVPQKMSDKPIYSDLLFLIPTF